MKIFIKKMSVYLSWNIIDQILVSFSSFSISIILAKLLGPYSFGIFVLLWIFVAYALTIQMSLINIPMLTKMPVYPDSNKQILSGLFYFSQLISSLLIVLISFLILYFFAAVIVDEHISIAKFCLLLFLLLNQDFFRRYFYSINRDFYAFIFDLLFYIPLLFFIIIYSSVISLNFVINIYCYILLATFFTSLFISYNFNYSMNSFITHYKLIFKVSLTSFSSSFIRVFSENFIYILSSVYFGKSELGAIKAIKSIFGGFHILFQAIQNKFIPLFRKKTKDNEYQNLKKIEENISILFGFIIIFIFVIFYFSKEIIIIKIFSEDYSSYSNYLLYWSIIYLFVSLSFIVNTLNIIKEKFKNNLFANIFSMITAITSFFLIKIFIDNSLSTFITLFIFFMSNYLFIKYSR